MKKRYLVLIGFFAFFFLFVSWVYAGKLIDKSSEKYFLFLPNTTLSGEKSPVLVCLPGWGISAKQDINVWTYPAEKNGFVVIDLDMNYNLMCSKRSVRTLYGRITNIINSLSTTYPVDTQRLYIAGTSAGGMMSISLALMFPDKFIAVGVVSGGRLGFAAQENLKNARDSHFYMVHGQKDKSIPIREFYSTKKQLERNGGIIESKIVPEGAHTLPSHIYREVVDWLAGAE